jgi:Arc/MetJ-type ribon-helix-helix transcriptional regulator
MKHFTIQMPEPLLDIIKQLVRQGHFHNPSHAMKTLMIVGLVEYVKQYYAVKEAEADA